MTGGLHGAPSPVTGGQPAPLRRGDRVRLVAASSALDDLERLQNGIAVLEGWGLEVLAHPEPLRRWGYLAGADLERRADLGADSPQEASPAGAEAGTDQVSLLACIRGGWGAARLLEQPLELPAGWLLGFSDVTSLLWAMASRGQGGAIHGPLVTSLATEPEWSRERLRDLLFGHPLADLQGEGWSGGSATGPLLAGNLTVATHLLGTRHLPPMQGAILILEDVGEAPYRLDRLLTHWRLCGALQQLAGIGLGRFTGCDDPDGEPGDVSPGPARRFTAEQVLRDRTADLGIPVVAGLPVGHEPGNAALPLGVRARLDGERGLLQILS
jgi:muramoyltetrapeptide carboxypeptidase